MLIGILLYFGTIVINWDANPPEQQVTSYDIYMNSSGGASVWVAETSNTTKTLTNVDLSVRRCIYVTATNQYGTSEPSAISCTGGMPQRVTGVRVSVQ